eukprot:28317-Rhodomonas_salina.2
MSQGFTRCAACHVCVYESERASEMDSEKDSKKASDKQSKWLCVQPLEMCGHEFCWLCGGDYDAGCIRRGNCLMFGGERKQGALALGFQRKGGDPAEKRRVVAGAVVAVNPATILRQWYAQSGTDRAYGTTRARWYWRRCHDGEAV